MSTATRQLVDAYLAALQANGLSTSTVYGYGTDLTRLVKVSPTLPATAEDVLHYASGTPETAVRHDQQILQERCRTSSGHTQPMRCAAAAAKGGSGVTG